MLLFYKFGFPSCYCKKPPEDTWLVVTWQEPGSQQYRQPEGVTFPTPQSQFTSISCTPQKTVLFFNGLFQSCSGAKIQL